MLLGFVFVLVFAGGSVDAKKAQTAATAAKKLPTVTKVDPQDAVIGDTLTISGKNIVKGSKTMLVIFQRVGSNRRFTARGKGISTKAMTVTIPDVSTDLENAGNTFKLRLISKYGVSAKWTSSTVSPKFHPANLTPSQTDAQTADELADAPNLDCDKDGILNGVDSDDDNDLLPDSIELQIGTDLCKKDSDGDGASDYYEYTVAYQFNGGPTLPYPGLLPYPNPLVADANIDFDGDGLSDKQEYDAWQYTGRMDHFYSDADQKSLSHDLGQVPAIDDGNQDEDHDLLTNWQEINEMAADGNWLRYDTDGDGLCDGLDDADHDGPPTPLAQADCSTPVPNNGPSDTPAGTHAGDPDPTKIDGDDNVYSNWYELAAGTGVFDPCSPSVSQYCPSNHGNPTP